MPSPSTEETSKGDVENGNDDSDAGSDIFMPVNSKNEKSELKNTDEEVNEDGSDTGSDIFMPDGITMKTFKIELDKVDEPKDEKESNTDDGDKEKINQDIIKDSEKSFLPETAEERSTVRKRSISITSLKMDSGDDDDEDDDDNLSGTLEITEGTPDIEEKTQNNIDNELVEDRNIFSNPDLFMQKEVEDKKDDSKEEEKENDKPKEKNEEEDDEFGDTPPYFENTDNNIYLIDKKKSRCNKQVRRMTCECPYEPNDPLFVGCDEDCLNRLLMIECSKSCPVGEFCTNRSFQKGCKYDLEIIRAGRKGWGLRTKEPIAKGSFVIEYCGEVVDYDEFHKRTLQYDAEGMTHYYFMTLKTNEIIDATKKGCKSRFINHSCDPNCVTQKWTVNGFLRVGFFALRDIESFEELCFDYQFQRFGEKPQNCYCGAYNCRGVIGIESTNSIPSYIEKISKLSSSPSSKQKKKKKQIKEFFESELAEELNDLLGSKWELKEGKQALELLRLMVKVETLHERKELLKILQSAPEVPLKAFVRYKGLSLLWSWMVDAPDDKPKYKVEILKTLKHIPVPNKNELDDSKLMSIIIKWAAPMVGQRNDENSTTSNKREEDGSDEESHSDSENKNEDGGNTSQDESSKEDDKGEGRKLQSLSSIEEGSTTDESTGKKKKKDKVTRKKERKESRKRDVPTLSAALLDEWKELKEVFRIPKKSQTPERRQKPESDTSSPALDEKVKSDCDSPIQRSSSDDKSAISTTLTNTKTMPADSSTFSSPPSTHKQTRINKGTFLTKPSDECSPDNTNKDNLEAGTSNNAKHNAFNSKRNGKREWRKSPNSNDERGKRFEGADSTTWGTNEDFWDRRDSRRNRNNRRGGFDKDKEWNRNWNSNNSWGGRGNRPWNNRGNRDTDENHDSTGLSWRKNQPGWKNQQQNQSNYGGNRNLPMNANVPGVMSNPRNQMYPGNMLGQNMLPRAVPPRPMFQQAPMPPMNAMLPNQLQQNSPLVSPMNPTPPAFNQVPLPPSTAAPGAPDVTALNVVNQLQLLLNAERLKQVQDGSRQGTPDHNRSSTTNSPQQRTSSASPTRSKPVQSLPPHWKTATDSEGRMYYYHALTRETSWDPPMHLVDDEEEIPPSKKNKKYPSDSSSRSPVSPHSSSSTSHRHSPRIVAADTTHHHHQHQGPRTPPGPKLSTSKQPSSAGKQRIKEAFKSKMSSVVVNCLNVYQKVDCKQGRIKNTDDFKFLARKEKGTSQDVGVKNQLTHGLILKEIQRIKDENQLSCNDSVKLKVKEYIRNYMKKFGVTPPMVAITVGYHLGGETFQSYTLKSLLQGDNRPLFRPLLHSCANSQLS